MSSVDELERGRQAYATRAWLGAHAALSDADRVAPLGAEDLELLATSAYMLGRDDDVLGALERAHHAYLDAGEVLRAVRCAFWLGINLVMQEQMSRATGWFGRAQRLLEREEGDCVERGYLLLPVLLQHAAMGDDEAAYATGADAVAIGERFGDPDLLALAVHEQGHALVRQGRVEQGLALLDEAMVAVTAGELSPIVTGLIYCSVIEGCQQVYELGRAREWTVALTRWCEEQPDMVAHTGLCLIHRAEILQLHGSWSDALEEARRARERFGQRTGQAADAGQAAYRQGEVRRLQGELDAAEEAYREASRGGYEPQPGLALMRLTQGNRDAAAATIRRALGETSAPLTRARLLPADVEIMLAAGDVQDARGACRELEEISGRYGSKMLRAMASHARGAVDLADGDAGGALVASREAWRAWQELEAPYEAARSRVVVGLACLALGDDEAAALELEAARAAFADLGAAPDLAAVDALTGGPRAIDAYGLTPRELEVLRLVAAGKSNREIASHLVISEHTVARHLQNIFAKLGVPSRTAASAFAFEHGLV
jgi:DNA-binding CsgD family transcriptional regulator